MATVGAGVLLADGAKWALNEMFDPQPTNAEVMQEVRAARLEQLEFVRRLTERIDLVTGITSDVRAGVGAANEKSHRAIIASECKRQGTLPAGPDQSRSLIKTAGR